MKGLIIVVVALALLGAGCGSSSEPLPGDEALDDTTGDTDETTDDTTGDTDDTADERDTDDGSDTDEATDDTADESDTDTAGEELSAFEEGLVEGMMTSGLGRESAECIVAQLNAMDVNILQLAAEISGADVPDELWDAAAACGDELTADGTFSFGGDLDLDVDGYGDDPDLDALWDGCEAGDLAACDDLYWATPVGSAYEAYGSTCGDRGPETFGNCVGTDGDGAASGYGDDPTLDALWDACEAGDGVACDDLYFDSPLSSEYEAFGDTCGNRFAPGTVLCAEAMGG